MNTLPKELVVIDWVDSLGDHGWKTLSKFEAEEPSMADSWVYHV